LGFGVGEKESQICNTGLNDVHKFIYYRYYEGDKSKKTFPYRYLVPVSGAAFKMRPYQYSSGANERKFSYNNFLLL
jgi:hypothetical protein